MIHLAEGITWNGGEADAIGLQLALYSNAHKIKASFSEEEKPPVIGVLTFGDMNAFVFCYRLLIKRECIYIYIYESQA